MKYIELIQSVRNWADEKGITRKGTVEAQIFKTCEEIAELELGIYKDDLEEIKDAVGDVFVTLVIGDYISDKLNKFEFEQIDKIKIIKFFEEKSIIHILIFNKYNLVHRERYSNQIITEIIKSLKMICKFYDLELEDCIESAYSIIAKRKGKIINGAFVKEK